MKQELHIESLIQKFNLGTISRDELKELIAYYKENEPGNELLEIYQKAWEKSISDISLVNAEEEYAMIIDRINSKQLIPVNRRARYIREILKYAALFVLAFSISWLLHNNTPITTTKQSQISYQNIEVPYGSKTKVELPDGSKVTLNSGSRLRYESNLGNDTRTVYLEGEAFFDVRKVENRPFYVNTSGIKIKVLGTSFNVKAYPEEKTVETTLVTGKVEIFEMNASENKPIAVLLPRQKAIFEKEAGSISTKKEEDKLPKTAPDDIIEIKTNINTELSVAWKDNNFVFDNERFGELITKIERWYNVEIELDYPALNDARFSGKFDKETIEQAMKALTFVTPFQYKIEKNKITIIK
jgi:ferric-dicitrate binding protein FerR (iron transport regulator)